MSDADSSCPLPCPFCGGHAECKWGKVRCTNESCHVKPSSREWWDFPRFKQQAIDEWNSRPKADGGRK